ncbi:CoA transferase [Nocardia wallacei]|uniref:CoA transferase n=1 Tax=Nocardia wallacei TaxID=480035 RepID=UPI0024552741|nr:CoA transferase [Nocardia wallacei]
MPSGPVNSFGDILSGEHVRGTGLVGSLDIPVAGPTPTVVFPVRIEGQDARLDRAAPRLGADDDVFDEWCGA